LSQKVLVRETSSVNSSNPPQLPSFVLLPALLCLIQTQNLAIWSGERSSWRIVRKAMLNIAGSYKVALALIESSRGEWMLGALGELDEYIEIVMDLETMQPLTF
jgi:hypothetical protein